MRELSMKQCVLALAVAGMMGLSFSAGMAQGSDTLTKLHSASDLLTKARALLNATPTRKGYGDVENAKKNIDSALENVQKAVVANGG
jgi:ApbE superfamily uncharacterized protein (UPF0280 family)